MSKILYTQQGSNNVITLCSQANGFDTNYISVLSGPNGVGKSTLLRVISDYSLRRPSSRIPGDFIDKVSGVEVGGTIKKTIALSGTINDRFPNNSSRDLRVTVNSFDMEEFYYFGPKYSGGIASLSRASNNITRGVLGNINAISEASKGLCYLLNYLSLEAELKCVLHAGARHKRDRSGSLKSLYERTRKWASKIDSMPSAMQNAFRVLEFLATSSVPIEALSTENDKITASVNIRTGSLDIDYNFLPSAIETARALSLGAEQVVSAYISLGILNSDVEFRRTADRKIVNLDEMSSGQWQLINCMFNLGIEVENETLILVDEPENSLHPQWQRDYIKMLRTMIAHRSGCHVVIATHAPLIISSVLPSEGEILSLRVQEGRTGLFAVHEDVSYGWSAGDILENVLQVESERPPELANAVNSALEILADPSRNASQLKGIARRVSLLSQHLPPEDSLRDVIDIIIRASAKRDSMRKLD
jgi:predicted ATPase